MRRGQADQIGQDLIERSIARNHLDDASLFDEEEFGLFLDRDVSPDPDEADHVAVSVPIPYRDLGGAIPPGSDPFAVIDDRDPGPDEVLLAGEKLLSLFPGMDVVVGLADEIRRSLETVMACDGLVGEHEATVSVLDIDRFREVADQEID